MKMRLMLALLCTLATAKALAHDWPEVIPNEIEKTYVPIGFDSNDLSQVVVTGWLSNTCLRVGNYQVKTDTRLHEIRIRQNAFRFPGVCLSIAVPFTTTIELGLLPPGDYRVIDAATEKTLGRLPVTEAEPAGVVGGVDDDLYALVTDAFVYRDSLVVDYKLPDSCTRLEEVRVNVHGDVLVVRPIAKYRRAADCRDPFRPQRRQLELPRGLRGTYLLHVRSMGGQALNKLVEVQ